VLVGTRKAVAMAVKRVDSNRRVTSLKTRLEEAASTAMPAVLRLGAPAMRAAEDSPEYGIGAPQ
jgi:hypothetical protein